MNSLETNPDRLLAHDPAIPHRGLLLDRERMSQFFTNKLGRSVRRCEIGRTKYRFGSDLRVLYDLDLAGSRKKISVRTATATPRQTNGVTSFSSTWTDDDLRARFSVFPTDRKIANLQILTEPPPELRSRPIERWTESRLIAYATEKCATAQCLDDQQNVLAYAKLFADDDGQRIFRIYESLHDANLPLPRAISYFARYRTLMLEAIKGKRLADLNDRAASEMYREFGRALARLHCVPQHKELPTFKRLNVQRLPRVVAMIAGARPDLEPRVARFAKRIEDSWSSPTRAPVRLHGDVHEKNAIWDGSDLFLIDLDQMSLGDAECDLGSFLGGRIYKLCTRQLDEQEFKTTTDAFLNGYASVCEPPSEEQLRWHTAMAVLAERATRSIARLRVEGLNRLAEILDAGERVLERGLD